MASTSNSSTMAMSLDKPSVSRHERSINDTYLPIERSQDEDPDVQISRLRLQNLSVDEVPRAPRNMLGGRPNGDNGDKRAQQHSDRVLLQPRSRCENAFLLLLLDALYETAEILNTNTP